MKHKVWKLACAAVVVATGVWVGMVAGNPLAANSSSVSPGTIEDPVVTKSYVDEQIAKLAGGGSVGNGSDGNNSGSNGGQSGSEGGQAVKLEVVELSVGKTLMAAAGTEVVVRVGKAVAYSSDTNGISDLTGGTDIKSGNDVPTNHLIWFPRDGRGIKGHADEKYPLTLIVKGPYTIQ